MVSPGGDKSVIRTDVRIPAAADAPAFHYHCQLPSSFASQPMWKYLDDCGTALRARYDTLGRDLRSSPRATAKFELFRREVVLNLRKGLGLEPFPDRTPLNARIVGTLDRGSFTIDKLIYESLPGFKVNALLYVPKHVQFAVPGVLSPSGHYYMDDFYLDTEQGRHIGLAKNGYVVLAYDPIGQGEREWLCPGCNGDHNPLRRKVDLSGMEVSGLMVWDSIRGIDYLCSRPEVDASRIGITGVSGGGFNSLLTSLLDPRVGVCATNGFACTLEGLIKRADAGCCAYTPNMALKSDYIELYSCLAPRPTLVLGGYTDILVDRVLPIYDRCSRIYDLFGAGGKFAYFLDPDSAHCYSLPDRVEMIKFFNKHLKGIDDPDAAAKAEATQEMIPKSSGLLAVFAAGEDKGKTVIDVERDYLARNRATYGKPRRPSEVMASQRKITQKLRELMGDMASADTAAVTCDDGATAPGSVRHVTLKTERDLPVTVSIYRPPAGVSVCGLVIYLQMADSYPNGSQPKAEMVRRLSSEGFIVADPHVRATYETAPTGYADVELYSMALGKHLFSTRIFDVQRMIDFLKSQPPYRSLTLSLWGEGLREGLMALYAAAVEPRIDQVVAAHGLIAYQDIVDRDGEPEFDHYVPGVLRCADTEQIVAAIAPRRCIIAAPVYITGGAASDADIVSRYSWAACVYQVLGQASRFVAGSQLDPIAELRRKPGEHRS